MYQVVGSKPSGLPNNQNLKVYGTNLFKQNGYNIKFKKISYRLRPWSTWYRVHMSVKMTEEEIQKVFDWHKKASFCLYNTSCKLINKHF